MRIYDLILDLPAKSAGGGLPALLDEADKISDLYKSRRVINGLMLDLLDYSKCYLSSEDQAEFVAYVRALGFDKIVQVYELT